MMLNKTHMAENIRTNLLFPVSTVAFFVLSYSDQAGYGIGIVIAGIIAVAAALCSGELRKTAKESTGFELIYGALCSAGACLAGHDSFMLLYAKHPEVYIFRVMARFSEQTISVIAWILTAISFYFVFVCVLYFLKKMRMLFKDGSVFQGVSVWEALLYGGIFLATSALIVCVFSRTDAFYWARQYYDVIYTSDSPAIFRWNAYMTLAHQQNDLRQPLFAVFCAPFLGVLNLVSVFFSVPVKAMLLNIGQIAMLIFANYLLARLMGLSALERASFVLLFSSTYTYMLFSLMMEQYIVAYFWLVLFLYIRFAEKKRDRLVLYGAGGTLLTSMVLLPFAVEGPEEKSVREWMKKALCLGIGFAALMLAFCRFDVFYSFAGAVLSYARFTGESVPFAGRVLQYLAFAHNVILPPAAEVAMTDSGNLTWQLSEITGVSYAGAAILILVIVSMIVNIKKQSTRVFAGWWIYSVVIMVFVGWGTAENGLILYSLYFGWTLLALLFQLVQKIGEQLHIRFLVPAISLAAAAYLFIVNFNAVKSMVTFMMIYYPL